MNRESGIGNRESGSGKREAGSGEAGKRGSLPPEGTAFLSPHLMVG